MIAKSIISSTHIDRHGDRVAKQVLESHVARIKGAHAIPVTLNHDVTLPPAGKLIDAWIEPTADGEYLLNALEEHFEGGHEVTLPDGVRLWQQTSDRDNRPFVKSAIGPQEKATIAYDLRSFASEELRAAFLAQLPLTSDFTIQPQVRKSLTPELSLFITLGASFATLLAAKTLYKAADKIAEDVSTDLARLYSVLRAAAIGLARFSIRGRRRVTYVFTVPGDPTIEFVARTDSADLLLAAIAADELRSSIARAEEMSRVLRAAKIQFLLDDDSVWRFNYLLTETGGVVGTHERMLSKARRFDLETLPGRSIGANVLDYELRIDDIADGQD